MKKVSIVIVNWNGARDTANCLKSLEVLQRKGIALETIVVDNGSTDDSVKFLSHGFPNVTQLCLDKNFGFTGGNNVGIQYAMGRGSEYIWLLNNDTIVDKNALTLLEAFRGPRVGITGSKIYFAPGREYHNDRYTQKERGKVFWYAGGIIDWGNMYASHKGVDEVDRGQYDAVMDTPFITGCSMIISRAVVEAIGMLDEKYYLYLEDLDYGLRAKRAGFRLVYYPKSIIWHVNAGSSGGPGNRLHDYYITRNRLLVGFRYAPIRTKLALVREAMNLLRRENSVKRQAIIDALMGKWGKQYEPKKTSS